MKRQKYLKEREIKQCLKLNKLVYICILDKNFALDLKMLKNGIL